MRLQAETLWLQPGPGPLLPQLRAELGQLCQRRGGAGARPLRWALTAAEQGRGVRIEVVLVLEAPPAVTASQVSPDTAQAHAAETLPQE